MTIKINNQYQIETDPLNFMLQESRIPEKGENAGKVVWTTIGYYSSLESAYKALITKGLKKSDLEGVEQILKYLNAIHLDIGRSMRRFEG